MSESSIPQDVQVLLRDHINTYERLEVLLLLAQNREAEWTIETLSERAKMPVSACADAFAELQAALIVAPVDKRSAQGSIVYVPATEALEQTVKRLAACYSEHPLEILKFLSASAMERVRNAALRRFADTFPPTAKEKKDDA